MILPDSIPDLIRFNGSSVSTSRPAFAWHPVKNSAGYKIEIANNLNFTNATSLTVTDTAFTPLADLNNGMWYWHASCSRNYALFAPVDSVNIEVTRIIERAAPLVAPSISVTRSANGCLISFPGYHGQDLSVTIFSVRGQIVAKMKASAFGGDAIRWNYRDGFGKEASNGLYVLEITDGTREIQQQRIIVAR